MNINTSYSFWSYAKEFLSAADAVKTPAINKSRKTDFTLLLPAYYLVGHSIELSLKAYLLAKGYTIGELRGKKYGHNLEQLLSESRHRKVGREVKLSKHEDQAIKLLNKTYSSKKFEYLEYGNYHLSQYWFIYEVAKKLVTNLERFSLIQRHSRLS